MEPIVFVLIAYFVFMNIAGYASMGLDKVKAKRHAWRIPEATLMTVAALGGSIGSLIGMYLFRHKTMHPKFTLGIPLILAVQVVITVWIFIYR